MREALRSMLPFAAGLLAFCLIVGAAVLALNFALSRLGSTFGV